MNQPTDRSSLPVAPLLLLMLLIGAASCVDPGARRRAEKLSRRVDSLAVTLTAVSQAVSNGRGSPRAAPDTAVVSVAGAPAAGSRSAPVTIVEFTDYQCPFCRRHFFDTWPKLDSAYVRTGRVRYVVRNLPLGMHAHAMPAARASRCAYRQGNEPFWAYHDSLFAEQSELSDALIGRLASVTGLDVPAFESCLASEQTRSAIEDDLGAARSAGISGTPSFVVGRSGADGKVRGAVIRGAYPYEAFEAAIQAALP